MSMSAGRCASNGLPKWTLLLNLDQALKMFFCGISGEPPQDPVVSSKSGHVYERRLIQKYITENGTDPLTGEKLEENDLITVKASTCIRWTLHPR